MTPRQNEIMQEIVEQNTKICSMNQDTICKELKVEKLLDELQELNLIHGVD